MTTRSSLRFSVLLALAVFALPPASAQTLARFVPVELGGDEARPLACELRFVREGVRGVELQPWPAHEIGWMFAREEGSQHNFESLAPLAEDATRLRLEREGGSALLVGWDLPPRIERMHPIELRAFLAARTKALPGELDALANATVLVRRLESLALLARPGGTALAGPSGIATSKSGQRMELRAMVDPSSAAAGSDFAFKLYLPPGGAANVLCRAVHLESRKELALELLGDGSLRAKLEQAGPWMIEAIRLRALEGDAEAALELASCTLVFLVRGPATPEKKEGGR